MAWLAGADAFARKLFGQFRDFLLGAAHHRVDVERAFIGIERQFLAAGLLEDLAHAGQRAEMARFKPQCPVDVGHRLAKIVHHEMDGGAAVPALGIVGFQHGHPVEEIERDAELLRLHRIVGPLHHRVDRGAA